MNALPDKSFSSLNCNSGAHSRRLLKDRLSVQSIQVRYYVCLRATQNRDFLQVAILDSTKIDTGCSCRLRIMPSELRWAADKRVTIPQPIDTAAEQKVRHRPGQSAPLWFSFASVGHKKHHFALDIDLSNEGEESFLTTETPCNGHWQELTECQATCTAHLIFTTWTVLRDDKLPACCSGLAEAETSTESQAAASYIPLFASNAALALFIAVFPKEV